jgi:hypothetical protein
MAAAGPPVNQWLSSFSFRRRLVTAPEMPRFVGPGEGSAVRTLLSGFDLAIIAPRDRKFGGNFASGLKATGCFPCSERPFDGLRTCERNRSRMRCSRIG